jgi:molybdopterin converting factor small subunit
VLVELFGVPRLLAGRRSVELGDAGPTLADVARTLAAACPALSGPVIGEDGWLRPGYQFAVDERFTRDPAAPVAAGSALLLIASSAGG